MILNTYILCCSPNIHSSPPSIWYNHIFPPLWSQVWRCTFFRQWHMSRSHKYNTWEEALRTTGWSITFPFSYFSDCKCISMQSSLAWVPEWLQWAKLPSTSDSQVGARSDLCHYNPPRCGGYLFLWHNPAAPDLNTLVPMYFCSFLSSVSNWILSSLKEVTVPCSPLISLFQFSTLNTVDTL